MPKYDVSVKLPARDTVGAVVGAVRRELRRTVGGDTAAAYVRSTIGLDLEAVMALTRKTVFLT